MRAQGAEDRLVTVQPGAIVGPVLGADRSYSLQAVERMLTGRMPGLPRLGFSFIDVRDVASLEVGAMTAPDAAGQRLIAAATFLWLSDVAAILRERLGHDARKVPRRRVPDVLVRMLALFDPEVRSVVGELGQETTYSVENARRRVGWHRAQSRRRSSTALEVCWVSALRRQQRRRHRTHQMRRARRRQLATHRIPERSLSSSVCISIRTAG